MVYIGTFVWERFHFDCHYHFFIAYCDNSHEKRNRDLIFQLIISRLESFCRLRRLAVSEAGKEPALVELVLSRQKGLQGHLRWGQQGGLQGGGVGPKHRGLPASMV